MDEAELTYINDKIVSHVRDEAYQRFGGPIMHTTVAKTLRTLIALGVLDDEALERRFATKAE